jgi:transposase
MTAHLTMEQQQLARRLDAKGLSLREIARQVGCSHEVVRTVVRRESKRPVRSDPWQPGPGPAAGAAPSAKHEPSGHVVVEGSTEPEWSRARRPFRDCEPGRFEAAAPVGAS